jgi:hypothetical protein
MLSSSSHQTRYPKHTIHTDYPGDAQYPESDEGIGAPLPAGGSGQQVGGPEGGGPGHPNILLKPADIFLVSTVHIKISFICSVFFIL